MHGHSDDHGVGNGGETWWKTWVIFPCRESCMQPPAGPRDRGGCRSTQRRRIIGRICELVDGVLVEKAMGYRESLLALYLARYLIGFVDPAEPRPGFRRGRHDATVPRSRSDPRRGLRLVGPIPRSEGPGRTDPVSVPDLAIEVLSESNTAKEMERKRGEYFASGVCVVWEVDPRRRSVTVYTRDGSVTTISAPQRLEGGDVLPGFSLDLDELVRETRPARLIVPASSRKFDMSDAPIDPPMPRPAAVSSAQPPRVPQGRRLRLRPARPGRSPGPRGAGRFAGESPDSQAGPFPRQGQAVHLPVHDRRSQPDGPLRPQAAPEPARRPAPAAQLRQDPQPVPRERSALPGQPSQVGQVRPVGDGHVGPRAAHAPARRRHRA